jgi:hypothetical protein
MPEANSSDPEIGRFGYPFGFGGRAFDPNSLSHPSR